MPTALISFKRLADGGIMFHGFLRPTKTAAEADLAAHAGGCPDFGPAYRADQTIEFVREVEYLPDFEGDELEEWLDALLEGEFSEEESEQEPIDMVPDRDDE